ncbi:hypothetical protein [Marinobacterium iners]|uniref:Uncharacterized protein n=1 Tax=Marinobacterium iners DSM 11526 TaxID=1122198 RepID=A0A1H3ZZ38_9GAMM|nr:hypothetical protein [Marinobacterium iners]SEA28828.1 hypothetical protein SAMN02745729_102214 [Marinobacterium iners DSM 11526]
MSKKQKRLFPRLSVMDTGGLGDNLYAAAQDVEEVLLAGGAVPGEDYTRLDLLNLVQPFVRDAVRGFESSTQPWSFSADEVNK